LFMVPAILFIARWIARGLILITLGIDSSDSVS